jgi:hypothetical protein
MPGIVDSDPLPPTPDEGCGAGGDLYSTTDGREWTLGHGGAAIDKWFRERALAHGRTAIHEHRRRVERASPLGHARLHGV